MVSIRSNALILLNEQHFTKGKFFLHVELVAARQASIVLKMREKAGYKKLQIIVGECPEFELRRGEKVQFSIAGALILAKHQKSSDMFIVFDDKAKQCSRQLFLEVNESNENSVAFVKFERSENKELLCQAMIDIGDHLVENKPTRLNDLDATGTSTTIKPSVNISAPSPYSKIISDKGLVALANAMNPGDLWQLLIFLGLTDDRIRHHYQDKGNLNVALAGKAALSEWRNNNIKAGEKELVRNLIQELESLGRVDVAEAVKTICKQNRYPCKTDFQH